MVGKTGKILKSVTWLFGIIFGIAGISAILGAPLLGKLTLGIPFILISSLLIPPISKSIELRLPFKLPGIAKVGIIVVLLAIAGMASPSSETPTSKAVGSGGSVETIDPSEASPSPSEVTETYFKKVTGLSTDYQGAHDLLSENAKDNYDRWYASMKNLRNIRTREGSSVEFVRIEGESINNKKATVNITFRLTIQGMVANTPTKTIDLVWNEEKKEWRINEYFNPYEG